MQAEIPNEPELQLNARRRAKLNRQHMKLVAAKRKERAQFETDGRKIAAIEAIGAVIETIPWIGAGVKAACFFRSRLKDQNANHFQTDWLREHDEAISELARDMGQCRRLLALVVKQNRRVKP